MLTENYTYIDQDKDISNIYNATFKFYNKMMIPTPPM